MKKRKKWRVFWRNSLEPWLCGSTDHLSSTAFGAKRKHAGLFPLDVILKVDEAKTDN